MQPDLVDIAESFEAVSKAGPIRTIAFRKKPMAKVILGRKNISRVNATGAHMLAGTAALGATGGYLAGKGRD